MNQPQPPQSQPPRPRPTATSRTNGNRPVPPVPGTGPKPKGSATTWVVAIVITVACVIAAGVIFLKGEDNREAEKAIQDRRSAMNKFLGGNFEDKDVVASGITSRLTPDHFAALKDYFSATPPGEPKLEAPKSKSWHVRRTLENELKNHPTVAKIEAKMRELNALKASEDPADHEQYIIDRFRLNNQLTVLRVKFGETTQHSFLVDAFTGDTGRLATWRNSGALGSKISDVLPLNKALNRLNESSHPRYAEFFKERALQKVLGQECYSKPELERKKQLFYDDQSGPDYEAVIDILDDYVAEILSELKQVNGKFVEAAEAYAQETFKADLEVFDTKVQKHLDSIHTFVEGTRKAKEAFEIVANTGDFASEENVKNQIKRFETRLQDANKSILAFNDQVERLRKTFQE